MIEPSDIKPSRIGTVFDLDLADREVIREVRNMVKVTHFASGAVRLDTFPRLETLNPKPLPRFLESLITVLCAGAIGFLLGALIL